MPLSLPRHRCRAGCGRLLFRAGAKCEECSKKQPSLRPRARNLEATPKARPKPTPKAAPPPELDDGGPRSIALELPDNPVEAYLLDLSPYTAANYQAAAEAAAKLWGLPSVAAIWENVICELHTLRARVLELHELPPTRSIDALKVLRQTIRLAFRRGRMSREYADRALTYCLGGVKGELANELSGRPPTPHPPLKTDDD